MNDREMLELAAKAAGLDLTYCPAWGCMARKLHDEKGEYFDGNTCWRPHIDDGDTLRLAANLLIQIYPDKDEVEVFHVEIGYLVEPTNGDVPDAIRRGVLRAAAEIGRQMQEEGAA